MLFRLMLLIGIGIILLSSCDKQDDSDLEDIIIGREFDPQLLGTWTMNFSTRDDFNGIGSWLDSLHFAENNIGNQKIYQFSELEREVPFLYYTDFDTLFIFRNKKLEKWVYDFKDDNLSIISIHSIYISYSEFLTYTRSE
ncbi:hypothetical protein [Natronoflexus pectinivorans]|uniref:Lipocalin-like protein n=1 Tax=Natronoflexus pectinivorans TaxID=682526 RepID=A0A4R2GK14_9BACT|nr:hypothetical protein [Natronoflexus pectinivorans]TCO09144.1 hypothetical protein EV194_10355 [Natronoflexus pectinivorans]